MLQTFSELDDEKIDWFITSKERVSCGIIPWMVSRQASAINEQSAWLRSLECASWSCKLMKELCSFSKWERASEAVRNLDGESEEGPPFQYSSSHSREATLAFKDLWSSSNLEK